MGMKFDISVNDGEMTGASVFFGADNLVANPDHPNFAKIVTLLTSSLRGETVDEEALRDLFDVGRALDTKFRALSERVSVRNGTLYLDGDPFDDDAVTQTIVRFYNDGLEDFQPLVNFLEKLLTNPNEHSRKNLYRWMSKHRFGITASGNIVAYKGVGSDRRSSRAGYGIVNGEEFTNDNLLNEDGYVIEMPRTMVHWDPKQGCSTGLHVANWNFARSWSRVCLYVEVNPRDVVSVPIDNHDQKMRVCRYKVIGVATEPVKDGVVFPESATAFAPRVTEPVQTEPVQPEPNEVEVADNEVPGEVPEVAEALKAHKVKKGGTAGETWPKTYEEFSRRHWRSLTDAELKKAAKMFDLDLGDKPSREKLTTSLHAEGRRRRDVLKAQTAGAAA